MLIYYIFFNEKEKEKKEKLSFVTYLTLKYNVRMLAKTENNLTTDCRSIV